MTNEYQKRVYADVERRDGHEPEFLQAVREVFESLELVIDKHPEWEKAGLIERFVEPERVIEFRVPWVDDSGKVLVRGTVENGYYTVITKTAGTYALVEKGSTITDAENTANIPQTGDDSNVAVFALLALAAAGMMGVTLVTRKRKSNEA